MFHTSRRLHHEKLAEDALRKFLMIGTLVFAASAAAETGLTTMKVRTSN
jgi:hypothetical protein